MADVIDIVPIMVAQHRVLQKDINDIAGLLGNSNVDCKKIDRILKQFSKDLFAHFELENNIFYVELLGKLRKANKDTIKTEQFMSAMKEIEKIIVLFLEKYKSEEIILDNMSEFKTEFSNIVDILNLRVEAEEAGVYMCWGMY